MNKALLGIAVAAVVLVGVMLLRSGTATEKPAAVEAKAGSMPNGRQPAEVVLAITPGVPGAKRSPPPSTAKLSPLMQEYESRKGRKALYDRLSQLPTRTPEESYVLAEVLNDCREASRMKDMRKTIEEEMSAGRNRAMATLSDKDPAKEARIAAWEKMFGRRGGTPVCAGFEDVSVSRADIRAAMAKAAEAGDPRARARLVEIDAWAPLLGPDGYMFQGRDSKMPSLSDAQLATLREALASNDPAAIMAAGRLLSSTLADLQIRAGPDERAVDPRAFYDAWTLVACDAGSDCGPLHQSILSGCFAFGNCDARDLREYLFFYENSPQQSQRVAEYQARIARAIQTGDWSYFQFHRGPPVMGMVTARTPP